MKKPQFNKTSMQIIAFILGIVAVAILSYSATYAFLVSEDTKQNEFKLSKNEVKIVEPTPEYPKVLVPGSVIVKQPSFKNTGNEDAYIRVRVLFSSSDMESNCEPIKINDNFTLESDGYYYYKKVLKVGETTPNIFDKIQIKGNIDENEIVDFNVIIYMESVNADGYNDYKTAFTAIKDGGNN